eukprot:scaffold27617_cov97-Skeletonema_marinoi.AAC.2
MELEAPPVPRTPLCCIFPGPRGPIIYPAHLEVPYKNRELRFLALVPEQWTDGRLRSCDSCRSYGSC